MVLINMAMIWVALLLIFTRWWKFLTDTYTVASLGGHHGLLHFKPYDLLSLASAAIAGKRKIKLLPLS